MGVWTIRINSIITIILIGFLIISSFGIPVSSENQKIALEPYNANISTRALAKSPWPCFRGNVQHTGLSPYNTSDNNGKLKWKFKTGDHVSSSPAIDSNGTIYVGSHDNYFYAINSNGKLKWKFEANNYVFSPAIGSDGIIYVGSSDGYLYAIGKGEKDVINDDDKGFIPGFETLLLFIAMLIVIIHLKKRKNFYD